MKKWLKWTLWIIGIVFVIITVALAWYWPTFNILSGTEGISGDTSAIPQSTDGELPPITSTETDWLSWFGPDGDRHASVTGIKTDWSGGLPKLWEVNYLCQGKESATWSGPVIRGNRLIICGRDRADDLVFCLNPSDGSLLWRNSFTTDSKPSHGAGPRATPFIDGENVYTFAMAI